MSQANNPSTLKDWGKTGLIVVREHLQGTAPVTAGNYGTFFTAPFKCVVREVTEVHGTASNTGTLQVEKLTGTQAKTQGTNILTATISTAGTANTVLTGTLVSTAATLEMAAGDRLGLVNGSSLTSSADLCVMVILTPIQ